MLLVLLASAQLLHADYEIHHSKTGLIILSANPGDSFALEVAGQKIKPLESDGPQQLYFLVDGRFLQLAPTALADFGAGGKISDEEILRRYCQYLADIYKQPLADFHMEFGKLPDGRVALITDLTPKDPDSRRQISLLFRYGNHVMDLGSVIGGQDTKETILQYLNNIAKTFVFSEQPLELERLKGNTYRLKKN